MSCSTCRVFSGPVCGACRAAHRIVGILQSGRVPPSEERRVVGLLRGVAGELSDLVEAALPERTPGPGRGPESKGETKDLTPGSTEAGQQAVKAEPESSPGSDQEEDEEEEPRVTDPEAEGTSKERTAEEDKKAPQEDQADPTRKGGWSVSKDGKVRDSRGAVIHPAVLSGKFDPHYLTKALHLRPAGKAAARAGKDRSRSPRRSTGGEAKEEDRREREAPRVVSGAPARSGHHHDERRGRGESRDRGNHGRGTSPERPPLVRRPRESRQGPKKKKKNNRGQKRRDRGKNWRSSRASGNGRRGW